MGSNISKNRSPDSQNQSNFDPVQSIVSASLNYTTHANALNLLKELPSQQEFNVLKLKINIEEAFNELSTINLKKLQQKFKNQSFVIFVAANKGTRFHIYWKFKAARKVLSLKPYNDCFSENDKDLCEFIADFLANSLKNGHSGTHPDQDTWANNCQFELHNLVDSRNYNLLLLASESGNDKPIEALLNYEIEPRINLPIGEVTAQDLAWQERHSNVLMKLCQGNLPFPPQIDINECSEELKSFIGTCQEFHKMVEEQNKDRLNEIINQNPNLIHFYDLSNKSALKAALDLKLIDMYEFLISKNLSLGPHEDTDDIWEEFEKPDKIRLRNINLKYLKNIEEKHISVLMSNTSLSYDEKDAALKKELILKAYKALNTDPRLNIILKVVAATKVFNIIFDFHRDSTYRIDPTTGPWTKGIFYFSGRMIVGARQLLNPDTENETFGVLIHELCHYAMLTVYQNQSDPFAATDQEAKEEFARIAEVCKANMEEESIIESVFEDYPEEHQPSELIVRPPHLIAFYSKEPELLQEAIDNFNELFDYYLNVVVPAMERALPEIEGRLVYKPTHTYEKLSELDKQKVQNAVVKYKSVKVKFVELFPGNSDIFVTLTSDHISQMLGNKSLNFDDPKFRYLEEQIDLKWKNLAGNLREKFLDSDLNFQGEIVKFRDLFEAYPDAFNALTSQQIIDVLSGKELKIGKKFVDENKFYVERKFIPEDAKLINFEYEFGHECVVDYETRIKHVENRTKDKSFKEFTNEFLKKDFDKISKLFDKIKNNSYFKEVYFNLNHEVFHCMHKSSIEIIDQAKQEKLLVLSSEAGAGKTVTFEKLTMEIKSKFSTRWVSYIDLPRYTELYRPNIAVQDLLKSILDLNSKENNFEVRIFKECFKSGNLVILWNAFDEISPTFNDFILNVFKSIHEISSNIQIVCTRPLYSDQLSDAFKIRTWQLVPFDEEKKEEFLREFFISENISSGKIEENIEKVEKIVEKLQYNNINAYNFETPLMLKLIAEIHENKKLFESANIYGIYEAFVEKKIEIWLEKSKSSFSIAKKLLFSGSLKTVLQKFAFLNELNLFSSTTLGLKLRKLQIMQKELRKDFSIEEISKMGILFINGKNKFQFSHKTLAEFFVAQFFIENIFDVDGSVDSDEAELRLELFFYLTKSYGETQQIITDFMTSYLQIRPQNPKKFNPTISKLLRTKFKHFFIRMLDTIHQEVFEFLFEFFKPDHDLLVDLLHVHEPETFYTAIFNPNYFAMATNPEYIISLAKNCLTNTEFQKLLTGKNQRGIIFFGTNFYGALNVTKSHDAYDAEFKALSKNPFWGFFLKQSKTPNEIFENLLNNSLKKKLTTEEHKEFFVAALSPKTYLYLEKLNYYISDTFMEYEKVWTVFEDSRIQIDMQTLLGNNLLLFFETNPHWKIHRKLFLNLLLEKVKKYLSTFQIFKMFLIKNILHEANWDPPCFAILWDFLNKHTSEAERRQILLQDNLNDKNFFFYKLRYRCDPIFFSYEYYYFYYDFTPFKIFHKACIIPFYGDWIDGFGLYGLFFPYHFNFTKEIYQKHFNKSEMQKIIQSSNDFLYYVIGMPEERTFKKFSFILYELFRGNKKLLKKYLDRKIKPTNLSVLEFVEDFRGLPYSEPTWFNHLKTISDIYENKWTPFLLDFMALVMPYLAYLLIILFLHKFIPRAFEDWILNVLS